METHNFRSRAFFHRCFQKYCPLKAVVLGYTCKHSTMQYIPLKHIIYCKKKYIYRYICVIFLSISFQHKIIKSQFRKTALVESSDFVRGNSSMQVLHLWPIRCDELGSLLGILYMILLMVQKSGQPVEVDSLCHYLQSFLHPRWWRISAINSSFGNSPGYFKEV